MILMLVQATGAPSSPNTINPPSGNFSTFTNIPFTGANPNFSSVTSLIFDITDAQGASAYTWLLNLVASTNSPVKGSLRISRQDTTVSAFADYQINALTDWNSNSGGTYPYVEVFVTYVTEFNMAGGVPYSSGIACVVSFARAGDVGSAGAARPRW